MPDTMLETILEETKTLLEQKCADTSKLDASTRFLGGDIDMDSLDLATLIVTLEEKTSRKPFRAGFKEFHTVAELADIFSEETA